MKMAMYLSLFFSMTTYASLDMRPGLWEVEALFKDGKGKEINPQAELQKALAKMPPEQRKQMETMMKSMASKMSENHGQKAMDFNIDSGKLQVCYTKDMLKNDDALSSPTSKEAQKCTTKILSKSSKKIETEFTCENGSKGTGVWNVESPTRYSGQVHITDEKGRQGDLKYVGKFVKKDCPKKKA